MRAPARLTSAVAALVLVGLSLGGAGTAYADPGSSRNDTSAASGKTARPDRKAGGTTSPRAGKESGQDRAAGRAARRNVKAAPAADGSSGKDPADHRTSGTAGTSGDPKQPQPLSNADENQGGANGKCDAGESGPYCSTRDGSPSMNGNGGGNATGKPCAGCVGKADNKNPKGQYPNGSDRNAGYECDRNNGIGKTNPAHTGCAQSTPPECAPSATDPCAPPAVCAPTAGNPCAPVCPEGTVADGQGSCVAGVEECTPPIVDADAGCILPGVEVISPPTVRGVEGFAPRAAPGSEVRRAAAVLPATGSSGGLALLAGAGFLTLAAGATAMLRRGSALA